MRTQIKNLHRPIEILYKRLPRIVLERNQFYNFTYENGLFSLIIKTNNDATYGKGTMYVCTPSLRIMYLSSTKVQVYHSNPLSTLSEYIELDLSINEKDELFNYSIEHDIKNANLETIRMLIEIMQELVKKINQFIKFKLKP